MAEPAKQQPRHGGVWRGLWASLLIGLGIPASVLLIVALAWVFRLPIAEWALETAATGNGLELANAEVVRLQQDGLEIGNLRLGDTLSAARIAVTYQPLDLIDGRVDDITVTGLTLRAGTNGSTKTDPGTVIKQALGRTPLLPFRRLILDDTQILLGDTTVSADATLTALSPQLMEVKAAGTLDTAAGKTSASATGEIEHLDNILSANLLIGARSIGEDSSGTGTIALQASLGPAGQLAATAEIHELQGEFVGPSPARVGDIAGTVRFTSNLVELEQLEGAVTLRDVAIGREWSFAEVPLRIGFADGQMSLSLQAHAPESGLIVNADLRGVPPPTDEPLDLTMSGTVFPGNLRLPMPATAHGTVRFGIEGQVLNPIGSAPTPAEWIKSLDLSGRAELDLTNLKAPGSVTVERVSGLLDWSLRNEALLADAAPGLRTQVATPQEVIARLGPAAPETIEFEWGNNGKTPASLRVAPAGTGWELAFAAGAFAPELDLAIETDLRLNLNDQFSLLDLAMPFLLLDIADLSPLGLDGAAEIAITDLDGDLEMASSQITGRLKVPKWDEQGIQAEDIAFEFDTSAAWTNEQLILLPEPSTRLTLGAATREGFALREVDLRLRPVGNASITVHSDGSIEYELPLGPVKSTLVTSWGQTGLTTPTMTVAGTVDTTAIVFDKAQIAAINEIVAEDVAGAVSVKSDGTVALDVGIGRVRSTAASPHFSEVSASIVGARDANNEVTADLEISNDLAGLDLRLQLTHNMNTNTGSAEVILEPLAFSTLVQPTDISPRYATQFSDVSGGISGGGTITWAEGALAPDLQLRLDALDLSANNVKLRGVEGDLRVIGLRPPATAPDQKLSLAINQGTLGNLPVSATFQLRPDGVLAIDQLEVEAIAGRIEATDLAIDTADPKKIETVLTVEGLDLSQLLALTKVQGFTGTGRLSGQVPVRFDDGQLTITDATLSSDGSGNVQFDRSKLPAALLERGDIVSMALETLTDFNYDSLDMQITKSPGGEGTVNVQLAGANPDVLEGHPFKFNIALESDFDELARLITEGLATADSVLFDAAAGAR